MAMTDNFVDLPGLEASGNIATSQYRAVKFATSAFQVAAITNGNTERPIGILQNDPNAAGEPAVVAVCGICKVEYGGSVTAGNSLSIDNSGKLIADAVVTAQDGVDLYHIALALEDGSDTEVHYAYVYPAQPIGKE